MTTLIQTILTTDKFGLTTGLHLLLKGTLLEKKLAPGAHTDLKWENGKVVRFSKYYRDPSVQ